MILLVDDNIETLRLFGLVLKDMGYNIIEAENGAQALKVIESKSSSIELLVTDIKMPEVDGVTLITKFREIKQQVPVIVMSAFLDHETKKKLTELGVDHFLEKPFRIKDLEAVISQLSIRKVNETLRPFNP